MVVVTPSNIIASFALLVSCSSLFISWKQWTDSKPNITVEALASDLKRFQNGMYSVVRLSIANNGGTPTTISQICMNFADHYGDRRDWSVDSVMLNFVDSENLALRTIKPDSHRCENFVLKIDSGSMVVQKFLITTTPQTKKIMDNQPLHIYGGVYLSNNSFQQFDTQSGAIKPERRW